MPLYEAGLWVGSFAPSPLCHVSFYSTLRERGSYEWVSFNISRTTLTGSCVLCVEEGWAGQGSSMLSDTIFALVPLGSSFLPGYLGKRGLGDLPPRKSGAEQSLEEATRPT